MGQRGSFRVIVRNVRGSIQPSARSAKVSHEVMATYEHVPAIGLLARGRLVAGGDRGEVEGGSLERSLFRHCACGSALDQGRKKEADCAQLSRCLEEPQGWVSGGQMTRQDLVDSERKPLGSMIGIGACCEEKSHGAPHGHVADFLGRTASIAARSAACTPAAAVRLDVPYEELASQEADAICCIKRIELRQAEELLTIRIETRDGLSCAC